jgi:hypothetical protein
VSARHVLCLVALLSGSLAVTGAEAAAKKKAAAKAPPPVAVGCTRAIPPFCIGVTSGKSTYALFDATPFIPSNTGVAVWGKVSPGPCGPGISVSSWKPVKLKCS